MRLGCNWRQMHCVVVIPCFRESKRLPLFLNSLCQELSERACSTSILIVDDGSGYPEDATVRSMIGDFQMTYPKLIREPLFLKQNLGKGGAVYTGWNAALNGDSPELLCFVDADGAVPAQEVRRVIEELSCDHEHRWDAAFGSRIKMLGKSVHRRASRHYIGRVFATFVSVLTGLEIYDSQCGLKVIRRNAYCAIAPRLKETRYAFDVELTLLLLKNRFRICEIPIDWSEVAGSKVNLLKDSFRMFADVIRIWRRWGAIK
jgi:dolichyl-phosphate beta-glucosyltransferase